MCNKIDVLLLFTENDIRTFFVANIHVIIFLQCFLFIIWPDANETPFYFNTASPKHEYE